MYCVTVSWVGPTGQVGRNLLLGGATRERGPELKALFLHPRLHLRGGVFYNTAFLVVVLFTGIKSSAFNAKGSEIFLKTDFMSYASVFYNP